MPRAKAKVKPKLPTNPPADNGKHPGGRPAYDRLQVGRDFVDWATNNPEALTVPMFAVSIGLHSGILRAWALKDEQFSALFKEGKEQIGINRLKSTLSGVMDNGIYKQNIGNYDIDVNEYMRDERTFDAKLSKDVQESVNEKVVESYGKFHEQLSNLRDAYSSMLPDDLNNALTK